MNGETVEGMPQNQTFPYQDGDVTVLGPEIFTDAQGDVISWKGVNYVRQTTLRLLPAVMGPALCYISTGGEDGTHRSTRVDLQSLGDNSRERAVCRALLRHALALLDATEPTQARGTAAGRA